MDYIKYKMSAVQAEIDYLKATVEEQKAIINQLVYGPGDIIYIHPYDLMEIYNKLEWGDFGFVETSVQPNSDPADIRIGGFFGKTYRQSVFIPKKSKNFK